MAKKYLFTTPAGIAAYAYFHKPDTGKQFSDNKYKVDLILPGDADLSKLEELALAAFKEAMPGKPTDNLQFSWKSGDGHKNEEFHGKIILKAKSKFQPQIVDGKRKPLPPKVKAMSGDEVRLVVQLYPYESTEKVREGGKLVTVTTHGVSCQLKVVQVVAKNAGGGGLDMLDEIEDGFDASSIEDFADDDAGDQGDGAGDNGGDF